MRALSIGSLILVVACGGGGKATDAPPGGIDGPPGQIDGPPNVPDAVESTCVPVAGTTVDVETLPGLNDAVADAPMLVTAPAGDRRMFIVNRNGVVQIYVDGAMLPTSFLDVNPDTNGGGESGLLGLAFHPQYATNRKFYVFYTASEGGLSHRIVEFQASATDPNVADENSEHLILSFPDQAGNHNGGMMEFGSDGYLYISVGDGGPQNDPENDAQNTNSLLGKILRIDVDNPSGGREYGIPADNPFVAAGGAPEVFIYGMRNPWRWSFDRANGNMYVGDVGQSQVEEITVVPVAQQNGADLGWRECEGTLDNEDGTPCTAAPNRLPPTSEHIRPSGGGSSNFGAIIGGQVYRGTCYPDLVGRYFYSDNSAGGLWSFTYSGGTATGDQALPGTFPASPASIHADGFGELFLTSVNGGVYHIIAR